MKSKLSAAEKKKLLGFILEHMRIHQLNQKEMALKLNVSPSALSMWIHDDGSGIANRNIEAIRYVCGDVIAISSNDPHINSTSMLSDGDNEIERFRSGLLGALIDSDLPADALKIALQIVKNYSLPKIN